MYKIQRITEPTEQAFYSLKAPKHDGVFLQINTRMQQANELITQKCTAVAEGGYQRTSAADDVRKDV